jgi:hypothetical protein
MGYVFGSWRILVLLVSVAAVSWVYLVRDNDWRAWVFAVPSTVAVLGILALKVTNRRVGDS